MSVNVYFCLMNLAHVMCVVILFSLLLYDSASIVGRTLACGSHKDISVNVLNRSGKFCLCIFHPICELVTHGTQQTHTEHTESEVPWSSGQPAVVAFGKRSSQEFGALLKGTSSVDMDQEKRCPITSTAHIFPTAPESNQLPFGYKPLWVLFTVPRAALILF